MDRSPPQIFNRQAAAAKWSRATTRQSASNAATYLLDTVIDDLIDRFDFMRLAPESALIVGDAQGQLKSALENKQAKVTTAQVGLFDEEHPYPAHGFDLIVHLLGLGTVNDLPGALIHARRALADGGLFVAAFPGAGSLTQLRSIMLSADDDRPAARIHPQVDNRAATGLLERAGFKRQVVDSFPVTVRYSSLQTMVSDLRDHGLTASLASPAPRISRAGMQRAQDAFEALRDADGKVVETFEMLVLTGWA